MNTSAAPPDSDPIMERLEDQLAWYDRKSMANQQAYRRIKIAEILAAAIIPFLAGLRLPHISIVVLITVLEGLLHLQNQYQQNWINYRSTCEALKHEKYTYLGKAAPYANVPDPHALLAGTHRVAGIAGARQVGIGSAAGTRETTKLMSTACAVPEVCFSTLTPVSRPVESCRRPTRSAAVP